MSRKDSLFGTRPGLREEKPNLPSIDQDIEKIQGLHHSIGANLNNALQNAILIGEILAKKKKELPHGSFLPWIESNLPFSRMTANKYLRLFDSRDKLPNVNSGLHLTEAFRLLAGPEIEEKEVNPKRSLDLIYRDWKEGKSLPKDEKQTLKTWIHEKAEKLRTKAEELDKEARKIK